MSRGQKRGEGNLHMAVVPKLWLFLWMASIEHKISYPGFRHFDIKAPSAIFSRTR